MNLKLTCFIVISILLLNTVSAQTSWVEYDKDIRLGKNLVFLANKIEQIKTDALDKKQYFFAEQIPSGISTIEYETVVAKEGRFSNGPIALQCMYKPEVRAYGAGLVLLVK